ncbi:alpha-L-arabinofuranosidase C-terminal domain-containing protein [Neobacillus sp. Marseille-QA0830]
MSKPIISIDPNQKGHDLGDLYGLFFEDLNHAADGGLYAEMVQNRSFEYCSIDHPEYHALYGWMDEKGNPLQQEALTIRVLNEAPLHQNNPHYLKIDATGNITIQNDGFNHGMFFEANKQYRFSFFVRNLMEETTIGVSLKTGDGEIIAQASCVVNYKDWKQFELILTAEKTSRTGRLVLEFLPGANLAIDMVSLFPIHTFKGRINGCRKDIAEMLADMKPKFLRFPGGCLVHDGSLNSEDRDSMYRWKNTVGPVEQRPSRRNSWRYNQSLGLGFYEYFVLCEDIGAKPLPVLPGGFDPHHQRAVPFEKMDEWVQDALDLVEFANGSATTKWGALRAQMGHPEPFHLEYLAIGNEEVGQPFFDRYVFYHQALREKYPDIKLINSAGPFAAGSEFERGWNSAGEHGSDLVDEHYYQTTDWYLANHYRYDDYESTGSKVFLGEYASWGNEWYNAVVEASYMIGFERNADKVSLACYAPLLANIDYVNWRPNMIWFDQEKVYGSQNYYVQKIFMKNQGTRNIAWNAIDLPEAEVNGDPFIHGAIGVEGDLANICYQNMTIVNHDSGEVTTIPDGTIGSTEQKIFTNINSEHYTIAFDFEKIGGKWDKGFKLMFGRKDNGDSFYWLLGGWQNQDTIIRSVQNGRVSDLTQSIWRVEAGKRYHCELRVNKRTITATIDNDLLNQIEAALPQKEALYINAVEDSVNNKKIVKLVNVREEAITVDLEFPASKVYLHTLNGVKDSVNSFKNPRNFTESQLEKEVVNGRVEVEVPSLGIVFATYE